VKKGTDDIVSAALERLRALARRISLIEYEPNYRLAEPSFASGAASQEIAALEATLASPLPSDYRRFLILCSRIDAMDVWSGYAIHFPSQIQRILAAREVPDQHVGQKLVPIGSDGGGNIFFMALPSGNVLKWRHDVSTSPFVELASSFSGFLERMAEDWAHFIDDDREWKYMAG
jgi:hypothetical protein